LNARLFLSIITSRMKFSLIGMSGSGKTYWSKKLQKKGFKVLRCDDLLEKKLGAGFKNLGYSGIRDVARWMGQPFDGRYAKKSQEYLTCEKKAMEDILSEAETCQNLIIDTTGSVIYLGNVILNKLSSVSKVVYIRADTSSIEKMFRLILKNLKPVIWGKSFNKNAGESNKQALTRCYPKLLEFRSKEYEKLADFTLDYRLLRKSDFIVEKFIELIK